MPPKSGHLHPNAKLNDDIVEDIIWRYQDGGNTYLSLAEEYGVEVGTVSKILRGHTWKHVTGGVPVTAPPRLRVTHCVKGHEYTPENTVWRSRADRPNPSRDCRKCVNKRKSSYRKRKRGNFR